ncbi:MAG TPA: YraN family protein [Solirubrobacteraceae bacterium]|jgi:putative endonuclease|nr:YraN family protein [Solirubrobacteraceae bacterium]
MNPSGLAKDGRQALGRRGEELAAEHLRRRGFTVLERNVRSARGEIDLIAIDRRGSPDRHALVFVEVKTRRLIAAGRRPREDQLPLAGLGARQRARLRRLAAAWLADQSRGRPSAATIRFDAVGVLLGNDGLPARIEHVESAW